MSAALGRLRAWGRDLGGEPTLVLCAACALLVVSHYQGSTNGWANLFAGRFNASPFAAALPYFWWFGSSLVLYLALPIVFSLITRGSFTRAYGFGLGDVRAGLAVSAVFLAVMIPVAFLASRTPSFAGQYPLAGGGAYTLKIAGKDVLSGRLFVAYEVAYLLYFVAWEFFFRGWILNAFLPRFGRGAILVQLAPFVIMHLGKPEAEALGSIVAGLALGVLALRTRSFWYGAFVHGAVAVAMDLFQGLRHF